MPPQSTTERTPLELWRVESLRLTAFPSPSAQIIEPSWWRDLQGEEPENRVSQPRKGGLKEEGPFAGGNLVLGVAPTRIDWIYAQTVDEKRQSEGFVTIGSLHDSVTIFAQLMNRWFELDTCPPVQRLAFGVVMLQPVENLPAGYRQLMQYLRFMQFDDVENTSDFLYQINRIRSSTVVPGLRINRLSKWSVAYTQRQIISMPIVSVPTQHELRPPYFACRLELDINTVHEFQDEFHRGRLSTIFRELTELGLEIANRGDIP
jgi:hypothetical protein